MRRYGIIGNPLGHSYSEKYFTELFVRERIDASYEVHQIDCITDALPLLESLEGLNVTYPYKELIIPYLTDIDVAAREIGAVNVVKQGKGYNTDWIGFRESVREILMPEDRRALLLGTGGVSKAIQYALKAMGMDFTVVSRRGGSARLEDAAEPLPFSGRPAGYWGAVIGYEEVNEKVMRNHTVIVNCTPLGMHPYEKELPKIPYEYLTEGHLLYDCIYNPEKTLFLQMGEERGCRVKNGLEMLHVQADAAWEIWREERDKR